MPNARNTHNSNALGDWSASSTTATLVGRDLVKHRGTQVVIDSVSLSIGPETRLGVLGPNGVGKSTLLRILAGHEAPDEGRVTLMPPDATVGYLAQEREAGDKETLAEYLARRTGVAEAQADLDRAAQDLAAGDKAADARYSQALERYLRLGGPELEAGAQAVFADLALAPSLLNLPTSQLSGGQAAKAALAALLLSRFDIVLLDEPTNDLDFEGLARLEDFLERRAGGLVVVSHDRAFLERIVTSVAEIDEASHRLTLYRGGWRSYLDARATVQRHAEESYAVHSSERERLLDRARKQRQWAVTGVAKATKKPRDNDKTQREFQINRTEKQASKVRSTEKAIDRLGTVEKPFEPWELRLELATAPRSGDTVARLDAAFVCRGEWKLGPIDLEIGWGERLGVLGPNGVGKTTLLGMILGTLPLSGGGRWIGPSVVFGELGQARHRFDTRKPLQEEFLSATGMKTSEGRGLLAKFGLGPTELVRPFGTLSPGERTRSELAYLMSTGTNCLVLDEPTNHLDLPAIEQLEVALKAWSATLLLVTHDRRLLDSVRLTGTVELESGAGVTRRLTRRSTLPT